MLSVKLLCLGFRGNRWKVTKIVIFAAVGDGFEIFGVPTVGDADTGNLALLCHIYSLLFLYNRVIGKLIPGDSAAYLYKTDDPLCISICLRNLIQSLLYKFFPVYVHHSFCVVFTATQRICGLYKFADYVV